MCGISYYSRWIRTKDVKLSAEKAVKFQDSLEGFELSGVSEALLARKHFLGTANGSIELEHCARLCWAGTGNYYFTPIDFQRRKIVSRKVIQSHVFLNTFRSVETFEYQLI